MNQHGRLSENEEVQLWNSGDALLKAVDAWLQSEQDVGKDKVIARMLILSRQLGKTESILWPRKTDKV